MTAPSIEATVKAANERAMSGSAPDPAQPVGEYRLPLTKGLASRLCRRRRFGTTEDRCHDRAAGLHLRRAQLRLPFLDESLDRLRGIAPVVGRPDHRAQRLPRTAGGFGDEVRLA